MGRMLIIYQHKYNNYIQGPCIPLFSKKLIMPCA